MIYAGSNRSLCALENMVHKMGQGILGSKFTMMILEMPDDLRVTLVLPGDLPAGWKLASSYSITQLIGSEWYETGETLLLKVPSAIVPTEYNFVLNAHHPDFYKVALKAKEPFVYDYRFVEMDLKLTRKK